MKKQESTCMILKNKLSARVESSIFDKIYI
jgi:hypothetical protein